MDNSSAPLTQSRKWIYVGLLLVFLGIYTIAAVAGYQFFFSNKKGGLFVPQWKGQSTVSGTIDLNGMPPSGAIIAVEARKVGESQYMTVATDIEAVNGAQWAWNGAEAGVEYTFRAILQSNNSRVGSSDKLDVVAPASEEVLRVNISQQASTTTDTSPSSNPSSTSSPQNQAPSSLSGTFNLNGYIPSNSTITIQARQDGTNTFTPVATSVPAVDNGAWSWTNAVSGIAYEVQAILLVNGSNSAQSQVIDMTAPATGEVLTINSGLQPPSPASVAVSGSINLNGSIPQGSTISIATRVTGTSQFNTVISGMSALNNATWSWNQATSGTSYDIQASLISNGNTVSQSQILTAAAPATGEVLTINVTTLPPTPPGGTITNNCVGTSNGLWQVSFNYNNNNAVQNAQQFQFQVGTSSGGNQMVSVTNTPSNPNQSQNYTSGFVFTQGQTYYAQYSYATCQNCNTFSAWSPPLQFYCNPANPTNTPTPSLSPTSSPTPVPTNSPTPSPIPSPTPTTPVANTPTPTN